MIILIGLGNPGNRYMLNRHNAGFMFCDYFIQYLNKEHSITSSNGEAFKSEIYEIKNGKEKLFVLKPQTYMNDSGWSVYEFLKYRKFKFNSKNTEKIIVASDELDMKFGTYKIKRDDFEPNKPRKYSQHNGVHSVEESLITLGGNYNYSFLRLKIGVDNRGEGRKLSGTEYLLSNFSQEEQNVMYNDIFPNVSSLLYSSIYSSDAFKKHKYDKINSDDSNELKDNVIEVGNSINETQTTDIAN